MNSYNGTIGSNPIVVTLLAVALFALGRRVSSVGS